MTTLAMLALDVFPALALALALAVAVAVAAPAPILVELSLPLFLLVNPVGQGATVTTAEVPLALIAEHIDGTTLALEEFQLVGTLPSRRLMAVRKETYDHVRCTADVAIPLSFENCSANEPSSGVYFCTMLVNPSE